MEAAIDQVWSATHLLARKHSLTSYDASYLELVNQARVAARFTR